jgi:hypothetical protein
VIDAVYAISHALQEMKMQSCTNDSIETSWISRHSGLPRKCDFMKSIEGEKFYKNLLNVKFRDIANTKVHFTAEGEREFLANSFLCFLELSKKLTKLDSFFLYF